MPEQSSAQSESLKTPLNQMETPQTDIIAAGGPSSSELLNELRKALIDDVTELDQRSQATREEITLANTVFGVQLAQLTSRFNSLEARLPSTSGRWAADFFTEDFVHSDNSAAISTTYGQATLPILSSQEMLVGEDTRGNVWIPNDAKIHYSYKSSTPDEVDWLLDDNTKFALDQRADTAWWRNRGGAGVVWVRVRLPVNLRSNKLVNTIIFHPFPALSFNLESVEYKSPAGTYTTADLTYLEGWDSVDGQVEWMGNVRLFIPQSQVTEIRLKLNVSDLWGFGRISVRQIEFTPTANLVVDFASYNPGTLGEVNVYGKDQDALGFLSKQINGQIAVVGLSQSSANVSPVVNLLEVRR